MHVSLSKRLESKIEEVIEEDQFGFRKGKGTRGAIGLMRIISERVLDVKEEMCLCFINWQKAFDGVDWTKLLEIIRNIGVNWRKRRLIHNLYMRLNLGKTDSVKIGRAVRQGCCISPTLCNLFRALEYGAVGERRK